MAEQTTYTILIVEDENPLLQAIKIKLKKNNFEVLAARTHGQAIEFLQQNHHIDGIWLDHYLLGNETGLDFLIQLKNTEAGKQIPVFVISNSGSPEKMQEYIIHGAIRYYIKSDHRLDEIIDDITKYLNEHHPL